MRARAKSKEFTVEFVPRPFGFIVRVDDTPLRVLSVCNDADFFGVSIGMRFLSVNAKVADSPSNMMRLLKDEPLPVTIVFLTAEAVRNRCH